MTLEEGQEDEKIMEEENFEMTTMEIKVLEMNLFLSWEDKKCSWLVWEICLEDLLMLKWD